jgi:hypothetical protein
VQGVSVDTAHLAKPGNSGKALSLGSPEFQEH